MALSGPSVSRVITKEELCLMEQIPPPCGIVIFGASGDLTHRKLLPALFYLFQEKLLPSSWYIMGVARTAMTDDAFRQSLQKSLSQGPQTAEFLKRCFYQAGDYSSPNTYKALSGRIDTLDAQWKTGGRRIYHLATPPPLYAAVSLQLGQAGLAADQGADAWKRLVVEKPFGSSGATAEALNRQLHAAFRERQLYRIDHYLGKETVQNILMFRFANAIYEPVWNHRYIDHVQITAAESDGVGHRAGYYEQAGALRDMFQNHLFQLLSLVAMEPPSSFSADAVRDEKTKVLQSLCGMDVAQCAASAIRGQYAAGTVLGNPVSAYRSEPGVDPQSATETFAALRVHVENWRWHGVPFYLRSGKRMARRETEIAIQFKHVPTSIFKPLMAEQLAANVLKFRIQPNEGIALSFEAKHPGPKLCMSTVTMHFDYEDAFGVNPPEAYARLFLDVMLGDQTLFARHDWLSNSWAFLDPMLDAWRARGSEGLTFYPAGSWGPAEADALLSAEGRSWLMA